MKIARFILLAATAAMGCYQAGPPTPTPDAGLCHAISEAEVSVARVLLADQPLALTLRSDAFLGCGCEPRVVEWSGEDLSFDMQTCGCCEGCECADPGYEASIIAATPAIGSHLLRVPGGERHLSVRLDSQCHPTSAPTALRVIGPSEIRRLGGPRLWWAIVSGSELLCCVQPLPAVTEGIGPRGEIALTLQSCVTEDCACVPDEPTPFEAWHSLGELSPGRTYTVVAGAEQVTFTVPGD